MARCTVSDLQPATRYYARCSASSAGVLERAALRQQVMLQAELATQRGKKGAAAVPTPDSVEALESVSASVDAQAELASYTNVFGELQQVPSEFSGPDAGPSAFQCSSFVTLPSTDMFATDSSTPSPSSPGQPEEGLGVAAKGLQLLDKPLRIVAECLSPPLGPKSQTTTMQYAGAALSPAAAEDNQYVLSCLLGGVFPVDADKTVFAEEATRYFSTGASSFISPACEFRQASAILGWNDTSRGALMALMSEELAYKQYLHDLKKHKKKYDPVAASSKDKRSKKEDDRKGPAPPPPVLVRPEATTSFSAVASLFPVVVSAGVTRSCHRMLSVGRCIQVFVLDLREGLMGKAQAKWLQECLEGSNAAWKIVVAGAPMALVPKARAPDRSALLGEEQGVTGKPGDSSMSLASETESEAAASVSSGSLRFVLGAIAQSYMSVSTSEEDDAAKTEADAQLSVPQSSSAIPSTAAADSAVPELAGSAVAELTVQSGIVLLSAGTPAPFLATLNPLHSRGSERQCFSVEVGVGNAHWPAPSAANVVAFEKASGLPVGLGVDCLFGLGADSDRHAEYASQVVLTVQPHGSLSIQILDRGAQSATAVVFEARLKLSVL